MDLQIQLKHVQVTEIEFRVSSFEQGQPISLNTNLGLGYGSSEGADNVFTIIFNVKLEDKNKSVFLSLKASAQFETSKPIDESFKDSPFAKINAPAIAFPYIRTFISNLTLNSGLNPIILPSFNFVKIAEGDKSQHEDRMLP